MINELQKKASASWNLFARDFYNIIQKYLYQQRQSNNMFSWWFTTYLYSSPSEEMIRKQVCEP